MENRVGFGPRLGAFLLDFVLSSILTFIVIKLMPDFFNGLINWDAIPDEQYDQMQMFLKDNVDFFFAFSAGGSIIAILYNLTDGFLGRTPGKMILGLVIAEKEGNKASIEKLMARFAIKNISNIIALIGLAVTISALSILGSVLGIVVFIGCFFVLGEAKLAFHDMIAKTAVFKKKDIENIEE